MTMVTLVEMLPCHVLLSVGQDPHSRGHCYISLDRRCTFLLLGTNLVHIIEGIEMLTNEICSRSCMYQSANFKHKPGFHKSFRTMKCTAQRLPSMVEEYRAKYQRVVICCYYTGAFRLGVKRQILEGSTKKEDTPSSSNESSTDRIDRNRDGCQPEACETGVELSTPCVHSVL